MGAKGAANRLRGNVNELSSFLFDGTRKMKRREKKNGEKLERSHQIGQLEWSTHVVQSDFRPTHSEIHFKSGTCGDRRQIE